jgi:hypothetical protein
LIAAVSKLRDTPQRFVRTSPLRTQFHPGGL